jgi:hypothetical protein
VALFVEFHNNSESKMNTEKYIKKLYLLQRLANGSRQETMSTYFRNIRITGKAMITVLIENKRKGKHTSLAIQTK